MTDITLKEIQEICNQQKDCIECPILFCLYQGHNAIAKIDSEQVEQKIKEYKQIKEKK